jgi:hypothetical protein
LRQPLCRFVDELAGSVGCSVLSTAIERERAKRSFVQVRGVQRASRSRAEQSLGAVLRGLPADNPGLHFLNALLSRFRVANIPVLVYIAPFNIEYIKALGISTDGLPSSIASIRRVVESQGAQLLDLHASLPDAAFIDEGDHYQFNGEANGQRLLARPLAAALIDVLDR